MKRLKLNRKRSRDQIRYRLHASIQAAAYLGDDPSREDIDRELKQIMTAGRPKPPSRSAPQPDHGDREDSGARKADREAQQVISGPRTEERVTAPGRTGVLTGTRFAVVTPARRTMGIGLITALSAIGIAVSPVVGSIAFAIELVVALTIIGAALFGRSALSERAFRLLRWIAYRPDPARPTASRNAKELQAEVDAGRGLADLQARLDERQARADGARGLADRESQTDPRLLTVAEVALIMRISKMTVYRLVHSGELETIRVGRSLRIPERAVMVYMRGERVRH